MIYAEFTTHIQRIFSSFGMLRTVVSRVMVEYLLQF